MQTVGIFTRALDDALLDEEIDLAVHSAKDMPSALPAGIALAAFLKREDPRDALLALSPEVHFENLSRKLIIGTSALRRQAFLRHYFPHVEVKEIRGNVDTRIAKMTAGDYDGILLAMAGVKRMGLEKFVVQKMNISTFSPAVGQGAIAVTCKEGFAEREKVRDCLNHPLTEQALTCERAFLGGIQGGCQTPAFGFASVTGDKISLTAGVAEVDGSRIYRHQAEGLVVDGVAIGYESAQAVLDRMSINQKT
jgi:hydroxymethylbilane synthase